MSVKVEFRGQMVEPMEVQKMARKIVRANANDAKRFVLHAYQANAPVGRGSLREGLRGTVSIKDKGANIQMSVGPRRGAPKPKNGQPVPKRTRRRGSIIEYWFWSVNEGSGIYGHKGARIQSGKDFGRVGRKGLWFEGQWHKSTRGQRGKHFAQRTRHETEPVAIKKMGDDVVRKFDDQWRAKFGGVS